MVLFSLKISTKQYQSFIVVALLQLWWCTRSSCCRKRDVAMNRNVWHPQKSIANDGSEEGGRGSFHPMELQTQQAMDSNQLKAAKKKAKIPRRRTPTVDVSALVSRASSTAKQKSRKAAKARDTYDTIESQDGPTILECSSVVYRRDPQANINSNANFNELCGWRDREIECYKAAADRSATGSNNYFDRSRLQTPAEGLRSNLQSRAGNYSRQASSYGKRKECCYVFQHFYEPRHYIDHYRMTQSYTTLNVPGLKRKMSCDCENGLLEKGEELPPEPKVVEQDPDSYMQLGVKSYGQDGADPYLRELVSRLGVRGLIQQTREQQLLRTPKSTPPSITKKTKPREDLVVRSNGKKSEEPEDCVNETLVAGNASNQDSSKMSRPATRSGGQSAAANVELPKIAAQSGHTGPLIVPPQRNKQSSSNSVISVNKYLQVVTSQQQQNLPEENEDSEEKREEEEATASQDCLPRVQSSGLSYLTDTPPAEKIVSATHPESRNTAEQLTHDKSTQGKRHLNGIRDAADEFNTPNTAAMKLAVQEQLMMLDNMQKERLISNKAHALGLTSRDWAKSAKAKRMLGNDRTKPRHGINENDSEESTQHQSSEKERTDYRHAVKSRPDTRMATAQGAINQTRASSRMDQTNHSRTVQGQTQEQATGRREKYRELEQRKRLSGDNIPHRQKPSESRRRREEEDERKLEKLRSIYDSSSRKNKGTLGPSRGPSRLHSRCGNRRMISRPVTRLASWEQTTKSSGTNQSKVSPSRPVTQAGQRRSKGSGDEPGQASPTRASVKEMLDLERRLDESCCWNEIPVKTQFHSKTMTNSGQKSQNNSKTENVTEMLDFDLNDIMLRAKHKSQGSVAMVTVRLRKQRNTHNRHTQAQYHTIHPSN